MRQQQKQDIRENELAMRSKAGGTCVHSILAKHKSRLNTLINTLFVSFVWRMPRLGFCPHKAGAIGDWQLFAGGVEPDLVHPRHLSPSLDGLYLCYWSSLRWSKTRTPSR